MNYIFFDYNDDTNEDCDIQGEDYRELLRVCFQYSEVFSVWISPFMALSDQLKPYEITVARNCYEYAPPYDDSAFLHFYRICPEVYWILTDHIHSIWEWIDNGHNFNNPETPHFYRSDGTCFFMCDAHNGACYFYTREGEDVSSVVSRGNWYSGSDLPPQVIPSPRPDNYRPLEKKN